MFLLPHLSVPLAMDAECQRHLLGIPALLDDVDQGQDMMKRREPSEPGADEPSGRRLHVSGKHQDIIKFSSSWPSSSWPRPPSRLPRTLVAPPFERSRQRPARLTGSPSHGQRALQRRNVAQCQKRSFFCPSVRKNAGPRRRSSCQQTRDGSEGRGTGLMPVGANAVPCLALRLQ